jgi:hypothetical protein
MDDDGEILAEAMRAAAALVRNIMAGDGEAVEVVADGMESPQVVAVVLAGWLASAMEHSGVTASEIIDDRLREAGVI